MSFPIGIKSRPSQSQSRITLLFIWPTCVSTFLILYLVPLFMKFWNFSLFIQTTDKMPTACQALMAGSVLAQKLLELSFGGWSSPLVHCLSESNLNKVLWELRRWSICLGFVRGGLTWALFRLVWDFTRYSLGQGTDIHAPCKWLHVLESCFMKSVFGQLHQGTQCL